jgi:hypothetical protein
MEKMTMAERVLFQEWQKWYDRVVGEIAALPNREKHGKLGAAIRKRERIAAAQRVEEVFESLL